MHEQSTTPRFLKRGLMRHYRQIVWMAFSITLLASGFVASDDAPKEDAANPATTPKESQPAPDETIRGYLEKAKLKYNTSEDGSFEVVFPTAGRRTQKVYIHSRTDTIKGAPPGYASRRILSFVAAADQQLSGQLMDSLLQESALMKVGHWAVIKKEDGQHLLLCTETVPVDADYNTLLFTAGIVAGAADGKEQALTKKDLQ